MKENFIKYIKITFSKKVIIKKILLLVILGLMIATLDFATKLSIENNSYYTSDPEMHQSTIAGLFDIRYIQNPGVAFGNLSSGAWAYVVQGIIVFVSLLFIVFAQKTKYWLPVMFIFIAGASNLIDRAIHGYVIDMIGFHFWKSFAIFNVADIFIVCSSISLVIIIIVDICKEWKNGKKI